MDVYSRYYPTVIQHVVLEKAPFIGDVAIKTSHSVWGLASLPCFMKPEGKWGDIQIIYHETKIIDGPPLDYVPFPCGQKIERTIPIQTGDYKPISWYSQQLYKHHYKRRETQGDDQQQWESFPLQWKYQPAKKRRTNCRRLLSIVVSWHQPSDKLRHYPCQICLKTNNSGDMWWSQITSWTVQQQCQNPAKTMRIINDLKQITFH